MKNKKIALILSGGGARGFFHLGVLKGLADLGIRVDRIQGTSAGALIGALFSGGKSPDEIAEIFFKMNFLKLFRLSFNRKGLISTKPLLKALSEYFLDNSFESLKIPLTVACTDIRMGQIRYFSTGELLKPLVASAAIPVIFEPLEIEGNFYVDGGPLDNLPVKGISKNDYYLMGSNSNPIGPMRGSINMISSTERAFFLAVNGNVSESKKECDLMFEHPGMGGFRASDLRSGNKMIEFGLKAVQEKKKELIQFI